MTLGANVAIAVSGLVTGSALARMLGPAARGELAAIQLLPNVIGLMTLAGLPGGIAYFVARSPGKGRAIFTTGVAIAGVLSLLGVVVGYALIPVVLRDHRNEVQSAAVWYLAFLPMQAVQITAIFGLWGMQQFKVWNLLRVVPTLCWLTALAIAAVSRAAPAVIALVYLALYAISVPVAVRAFAARANGRAAVRPGIARRLVAYSLPTAVATVPLALNMRLDQALMAAVLPAAELGFYVVAISWAGAMGPLTSAVASVLFPRVASARAAAAIAAFEEGVRLSVLLAAAGTVVVAAMTPLAVSVVFGHAYEAATRPALILVAAAGLASVNGVLEEGLRALGGTRWPMLGQIVALPVTIAMLFLLLRPLGVLGAAVSSLGGSVAVTGVLAWGALRMTRRPGRMLFLPTRGDCVRVVGELRVIVRSTRGWLPSAPGDR